MMKPSNQKKFTGRFFLLMIFFVGHTAASRAQEPHKLDNGNILLENFQQDEPGTLPLGWYNRDGNKKLSQVNSQERSQYKYKIVQENNNRFLRYEGEKAMHMNLPLINADKDNIYNIDLSKTPVLSWDWRVFQLPKEADEDDNDQNDTAASVYVVFDFGHVLFKKVPKTIRYTWSSTLPVGNKVSKLFGNQKIIVLKSGVNDVGKWVHMQRNIKKDYERLFGDDAPKSPLAILILSDGDSTHSPAKADYDNFMLMKHLQ